MSQDKTAWKRNRRKAVPVLGAAGLSLTLASGASAAIDRPTTDVTAPRASVTQALTLAEEDISGVSLATLHVFDKEDAAKPQRSAARDGRRRLRLWGLRRLLDWDLLYLAGVR